jgi:hypothetical protein
MHANTPGVDNERLAIGFLTVTAVILFVGFLLITGTPREAGAIGMNDRGGDYIMATQQLTSSNEGIVVIDAAAKRMIVYGFDYSRKQLVALDGFAMENLQKPRGDDVPASPRP